MSSTEDIRQVAIDHHHQMAGLFESRYRDLEANPYSCAFTYGRTKIDRMVDDLFAALPQGSSILDVGCGTGEHLKRAIGHGLKASGIEPAEGMLQAARRDVPDAHVEQGVATKLPFDDAQFDAVIMIEVLRYLDATDIHQALVEARRVLKPGGVVLVTLCNRWALDGFWVLQKLRQVFKHKSYDETNPFCLFFTPAEARRTLGKAGFVETRTEGRMLAPLRIAYRLNQGLGGGLARALEKLDDKLHRSRATHPFAGHLIAIGKAPGAAGKSAAARREARAAADA